MLRALIDYFNSTVRSFYKDYAVDEMDCSIHGCNFRNKEVILYNYCSLPIFVTAVNVKEENEIIAAEVKQYICEKEMLEVGKKKSLKFHDYDYVIVELYSDLENNHRVAYRLFLDSQDWFLTEKSLILTYY
jgi:hypothetical protein